MQITLYGINYTVKTNASISKFIRMIENEDTVVLYVTPNKKVVDDYDTILLINVHTQELFPMFLSVFNELVEPYYIPVIQTVPNVRIIESNASDFMICSMSSMNVVPKFTENQYIAYGTVGNTLYVCPDKTVSFARFTTTPLEASKNTVPTQRVMIKEEIVSNNKQSKQPYQPQLSYKPTEPKPMQRPQTSVSQPKHDFTPVAHVNVPAKPKHSGPSKENLFKYCEYKEGMLVIHLIANNALAFINKQTGVSKIVGIDEILSNPIIGFDDATVMVRQFGKVVTMMQDVERINVVDIRNVIRLFESKKDSSVTKQMISYSNKQLYIAFASDNALEKQISIKEFTISSHRDCQMSYEKLKEKTMCYAKDVYFIITQSDCGVIAAGSDPKKPIALQYIPLDKIYDLTGASNIGDIMRMFPVEKIVDGNALKIPAMSHVKGVSAVSSDVLKLVANKYEVRNIVYSYDTRTEFILRN